MSRTLSVSFEFFPPKNARMEEALWSSIKRLEPLQPQFVSVTYGAGGSTRERTHDTVARLVNETELNPAAHLTCVSATRQEVDQVIDDYEKIGVKHIVALRGDPAEGVGALYTPHPQGYQSSVDLVASICARGNMEVSVSAYPEKHPESPDWDADIDMLKRKADAGATRAITQFFFDNDLFEAYLERVAKAGITIPVVPGLAPVHSFKGLSKFAKNCGATIPPAIAERFAGLDDDPKTHELVAAATAAEQVHDLMDRGINHFHFYTMNKADLVFAICHLIGIRPDQQPEPASKIVAA
jgi:methylenetetrahydrofolate reductase (NADPH)